MGSEEPYCKRSSQKAGPQTIRRIHQMSRINTFALVVAFVVFAVTPSMFAATAETQETVSIDVTATPSKVCHPKKPITCRANDVSALSLTEQVVRSEERRVGKECR